MYYGCVKVCVCVEGWCVCVCVLKVLCMCVCWMHCFVQNCEYFFAKPMMIFPLPTFSVVVVSCEGELPKLL